MEWIVSDTSDNFNFNIRYRILVWDPSSTIFFFFTMVNKEEIQVKKKKKILMGFEK